MSTWRPMLHSPFHRVGRFRGPLLSASLRAVEAQRAGEKSPQPQDIWRLVLVVIGVVAIVQELRKPPELRSWHGKVFGFVPYEFRKPTAERFRHTYWNPDGPAVSGKAWGVGWAPNFGAVKRFFGG